jgi:hypothetical protein
MNAAVNAIRRRVQRRKPFKPKPSRLELNPRFNVGNREVVAGDIIKVHGEHGDKFKVIGLVTNIETGVQWVDCYELCKGVPAQTRAFYLDRIKPLPRKRKKKV